MFITLFVVARKRKKALRSHQCPFTKFYSFHLRQFFSNEKRQNLLAWLITVTTVSQRISLRPSARVDPVLVCCFLILCVTIVPQLQLWHFRWSVSLKWTTRFSQCIIIWYFPLYYAIYKAARVYRCCGLRK
jgi:hypothetical protein